MGRQQDTAANVQVRTEQAVDGLDARAVERVERLVQNPKGRPLFQCQTCQSRTAPLTLGQRAHRCMATMVHVEPAQGSKHTGARVIVAVKPGHKLQRFADRQVVLHGVEVADVHDPSALTARRIRPCVRPVQTTFVCLAESDHGPQERRLAAAIGPSQPDQLTWPNIERKTTKKPLVASLA